VSAPPGALTLLDEISAVGRSARTGGYRRFAWTPADHELREWFAARAAGLGLTVVEDRVGNQWAWWGDPDADGPGVVTGSHLDSVPDGGAYDGPLGVASSLAAVARLRAEGFAPARPVAVANFVDEEGARFGVACAGSRVLTGSMSAEHALGLRDADGVSAAEALRAAGRDPATVGRDDETLARVGTFVELHVEQGRHLADTAHAVAVGSSIWPHGRWRFDLAGEANHAGTTRLVDRHDPMLDLAALVLAAREVAEASGCVATVGKVAVQPNGVNAIPSSVTGWLDARGPDEAAVRALVPELERRLGRDAVTESFTADTRFDPALASRLAALLGGAPMIGTGAGHDAGVLATHGVPTAMLFVRNPTGVSHSPTEHADPADCEAGVDALVAVLHDLTGPQGPGDPRQSLHA